MVYRNSRPETLNTSFNQMARTPSSPSKKAERTSELTARISELENHDEALIMAATRGALRFSDGRAPLPPVICSRAEHQPQKIGHAVVALPCEEP